MSVAEILSSASELSHAEKFRLIQLLLEQLAREDSIAPQQSAKKAFDPRQYFGIVKASRQEIDDYLHEMREGWR